VATMITKSDGVGQGRREPWRDAANGRKRHT
jgi:hypothetical protein